MGRGIVGEAILGTQCISPSIHPSFRIILTCSSEGSLALLTGADAEAQREQVLAQSHTLLSGEAGRARVARPFSRPPSPCLLPPSSGGLNAHQLCSFSMYILASASR